jgi:hypothetical protein
MSSPSKTSFLPSSALARDSRKSPHQRNDRYAVATLTIIFLAGFAIRIYQLSARSLWFDEAFSWRIHTFHFAELFQRVGRDNHPPLYFILLKGWASFFGESAFALRSLSVLFGSLSILGAFLFATEAFGKNLLTAETNDDLPRRGYGPGLLAGALIALSAFQVRYSQELRMYTLAAALAIFSSWALFRALRPLRACVAGCYMDFLACFSRTRTTTGCSPWRFKRSSSPAFCSSVSGGVCLDYSVSQLCGIPFLPSPSLLSPGYPGCPSSSDSVRKCKKCSGLIVPHAGMWRCCAMICSPCEPTPRQPLIWGNC